MIAIKKTALTLMILSGSSAFAGTMGPVCTPGNVTVPCEAIGWDIAVDALYFQPSYTDGLGFLGSTATNLPPPGLESLASIRYNYYDPDYNWGFRIEGSYHFSTGNDLNVNWSHFDNDDVFNFLSDLDISNGIQNDNIRLRRDVKWDAVNVELGQHVDFSAHKKIRFHGGLQYARIKTSDSTFAIAVLGGSATSFRQNKFDGVGPRVGTDMLYQWDNGFGVFAKGAAAVLVGDSDAYATTSFTTNPFTPTATGSKHNSVVPELEADIGAQYGFALGQGDLNLHAGWRWINYFNVQTNAASDANFSLQGPYVGLKWLAFA